MKISAPSFIIPDTRYNNIVYLKAFTDEVELLYLDSRHDFDMPDAKEISALKSLKMNYSVHLPTDLDLNSGDGWRVMDIFIETLAALPPVRYVIHPAESTVFLTELKKRRHHNIIIENTDFYGSFFDDAVSMSFKLCFDNAHAEEKASDFLEKYAPHISEYHLQGNNSDGHHKSLEYIENSLLKSIFRHAEKYSAAVCLEVFNEADFLRSYEIFKGLS